MNRRTNITLDQQGSIIVERCFHQIFRPGEHYATPKPGKGHCYYCTFHPQENKNCTCYTPIRVTYHLAVQP